MPWCSNQPFSLPTDLVAQALHSSSVKTSERQLQQSFGDHLLAISFIMLTDGPSPIVLPCVLLAFCNSYAL